MEGSLLPGEKIETDDPEKLDDKLERRTAPEAHELHGPEKAHEHIGQVLLTAEASGDEKPEKLIKQTEKQISTLNRAELLALSEKIMVDGTSLRQIYETHLIGESGLRRLMAEHLRGGDVKKSLRHEILEHELDFERDPAMRDMADTAIDALSETAPDSSKANFENMVEKASAGLGDKPQSPHYKTKAALEGSSRLQPQQIRRLLDVSMIAVITFLVLAIIILLLTRH